MLYENGDILFQYQAMTFSGSWYCGAAGIEDSAGEDGLTSVGYCTVQPPSNKAVRYYRPAPSARALVRPTYLGSFARPGETVTYPLRVRNTGDYGADFGWRAPVFPRIAAKTKDPAILWLHGTISYPIAAAYPLDQSKRRIDY